MILKLLYINSRTTNNASSLNWPYCGIK